MESRSGTDAFPDANAGEASRGCCELPGVLLEDEARGVLKENLRATRFSSEALFSVSRHPRLYLQVLWLAANTQRDNSLDTSGGDNLYRRS